MERSSKCAGDLRDFYHHLGTLVIKGKDYLERQEKDWVSILSKSGFPDLADRYENLLLTAGSDDLYREGLVALIASAGSRVRASIGEEQEEEEIARVGDIVKGRELPEAPAASDQRAEDISYLTHLLGVGTLLQKRAAANALGNFLLRRKEPVDMGVREEAAKILAENRDPEIAYEVTHALSFAPGSEGKRAKAELARAGRLMSRLREEITSYWEGLVEMEPVVNLSSDEIITLGIWMRQAPDYVVGHVEEVLLELLAAGDDKNLSSCFAALVYSADTRLLPVFVRILQDGELPSRIEAIKAIAHIDDPRSYGALEKAFRHTKNDMEKIVLARALARMGSDPHAGYLSSVVISEKRPEILEEALKATGEAARGDARVREAVRSHLDSALPAVVRAAVRGLSGVGEESDIEALGRIAEKKPWMKALVKKTAQDLYSRIILRGSQIARKGEEQMMRDVEKRRKPGLRGRILAACYFLLALVWILFNKPHRSLACIDRGLHRDPGASWGQFMRAYTFYTMGKVEMAVDTYRQAAAVDPSYTWRRPDHADRLVRAWLARSVEIETKMGSPVEAFLLLDDLDGMDLRRADPNLKIEVERRKDYLKFTAMMVTRSAGEE